MSVVITGASKGIGRDCALSFADKGETILLNYLNDDAAAQRTSEEIVARGGACEIVKADAGTVDGCAEIARCAKNHSEPIAQVVHCALDPLAEPVLSVDPNRFAQALTTNGTSLLFLVQALLPQMDRGSSVFWFTSRGGRIVVENYAAIGVAKSLAEGLMRYLAVELAPRGIRINALAPSIVETDAVKHIFPGRSADLIEHARETNPSGRAVDPEDYISMLHHLASPVSSFVTGQIIFINGGANLSA